MAMQKINFTLTKNDDDSVLAHDPKCPMVQEHRATGKFIVTLYDCQRPLPPDVEKHKCLEKNIFH